MGLGSTALTHVVRGSGGVVKEYGAGQLIGGFSEVAYSRQLPLMYEQSTC